MKFVMTYWKVCLLFSFLFSLFLCSNSHMRLGLAINLFHRHLRLTRTQERKKKFRGRVKMNSRSTDRSLKWCSLKSGTARWKLYRLRSYGVNWHLKFIIDISRSIYTQILIEKKVHINCCFLRCTIVDFISYAKSTVCFKYLTNVDLSSLKLLIL